MHLPVLYQDPHYIVINKPAGLLVHRTSLVRGETEFAADILQEQIKASVFTVHRLDRPTSGLLTFALSSVAAQKLSQLFQNRQVKKKYIAVVRGLVPDKITVDYPLREELDAVADSRANQNKPPQDAVTHFKCLAEVEVPIRVDKFPTSRYSLVECEPVTGRKHQIRRHLRHLGNPIIGDVNHGVGKHNRFFASHFGIKRLLLAATEMSFQHPFTSEEIYLKASPGQDFEILLRKLNWPSHAKS